MKLLSSPIGKYYMIAALLTNAHTTCYKCETSMYFKMPAPSLEEFVQYEGDGYEEVGE